MLRHKFLAATRNKWSLETAFEDIKWLGELGRSRSHFEKAQLLHARLPGSSQMQAKTLTIWATGQDRRKRSIARYLLFYFLDVARQESSDSNTVFEEDLNRQTDEIDGLALIRVLLDASCESKSQALQAFLPGSAEEQARRLFELDDENLLVRLAIAQYLVSEFKGGEDLPELEVSQLRNTFTFGLDQWIAWG